MKINILDPGLEFKAGHHFDHGRKLAGWLTGAGHDVHVYGFSKMRDDAAKGFADVGGATRLFTLSHYELAHQIDGYAGELLLYERQTAALAKDLKGVRKADLWLWPSMRAHDLNACTRFGAKVPVVGCIHEDPGIDARTTDAQIWRHALVTAYDEGLPYTVGALETELRHRYMPIVPDGRFFVFPQPYDGPPIDRPKTALKRIGFFGYQRVEKGTRHLLPLLTRLLEDGYEVVFQDSNEENGDLKHPKLEVLRFVEDLDATMAACDVIVLPYNIAQYRMKGSGILAGCRALGVPVIGPFGTIPGRTIEEAEVGPLFPVLSSQALYATIKFADQNFAHYAERAHKSAREFLRRNGTARFAKAFLTGMRKETGTRPQAAPAQLTGRQARL